jgi:Glucose/sorbosone dehydrogenases
MPLCKSAVCTAVLFVFLPLIAQAVDKPFHDAPASAKAMKNPLEGQPAAVEAGRTVYSRNCLSCHGKAGQGTGNVPSLVDGKLQGVTEGEIFWFITKGSPDNGMPAWGFLPEEKRWQVISYVEAMASGKVKPGASSSAAPSSAAGAENGSGKLSAAPPKAPFTDFRYEKPGTTRKITVADLPAPFATKSAENGADEVARPENAWPVAPAGFKVEMFASGLENPRWMRTAPNGDIFLAEMRPGRIRVFRGMTGDGKPEQWQFSSRD